MKGQEPKNVNTIKEADAQPLLFGGMSEEFVFVLLICYCSLLAKGLQVEDMKTLIRVSHTHIY